MEEGKDIKESRKRKEEIYRIMTEEGRKRGKTKKNRERKEEI
jgi:hypothetical protein